MVHARFLGRFHHRPDPAALSSLSDSELLKASDRAYARMENDGDPNVGEHLATYSAACLEIERRLRLSRSLADA